jgi:transposase
MGRHPSEAQSQKIPSASARTYSVRAIWWRGSSIGSLIRRIATRYDKLAANYRAFVQLASIRPWLRVYEFTT